MKMRHVVAITSAALISFGAFAEGQRQSSSAGGSADAMVVRQAQNRLASEGFAQTPQGLKDFQESRGLEPSGRLDAQTLAALGIDAGSGTAAGASPRDATESSPERAAEPAEQK